jgi:hypothetical protein
LLQQKGVSIADPAIQKLTRLAPVHVQNGFKLLSDAREYYKSSSTDEN